MPIRVLIVDDHALLREGLRQVFHLEPDIEVVGEACSGDEAVRRSAQLRPDLVVMDINLPDMSGIEATRQIRAASPSTRVLVLTIHDQEEYLLEAIAAGASGFVLKDVEPRTLLEAVRLCCRGEGYVHPTLSARVLHLGTRRRERWTPLGGGIPEPLTRREFEVLQLVAEGVSNREIGQRLFISEKTVKNHITSIFRKLGVSDRTQAVIHAIREGWVKV
ncbi:MAG TPA: response regulator transcription factor [Thermaerobacter sp.]